MSVLSDDASVSSTASKLAEDSFHFATWAKEVKLDTNIIPKTNLPELLNNILEESRSLPGWITNPDAPQFRHSPAQFRKWVQAICKSVNPTEVTLSDDDVDLSNDVEFSIDKILGITANDQRLQHLPQPTEADRRDAVDYLMSYTWGYLTKGRFLHRKECAIQLPKNTLIVREARADSVVFIRLNHVEALGRSGVAARFYSSLAGETLYDNLCVLHWVSQFKQDPGQEYACLNQVLYGLVSGLYQRRALGFPSHFVFGTVHKPPSDLDVLAATWASTEGESEANVGHADQLNASGSEEQNVGETHSGPQELATSGMIVVYHLGSFSMASAYEMLLFSLLMRRIRILGQNYKKEIEEVPTKVLRKLKKSNPEIYDWLPSPEPRKSRRQQSSLSLDSASEETEERHKIGVVGIDTPLNSINPDDKVARYLATSVHNEYEELSDEGI